MIDLAINTVVEWLPTQDGEESNIYRVLWVDPSRNKAVLFDMKNERALPSTIDLEVLTTALEEGSARQIEYVVKKNLLLDDDVSKEALARREWAWGIISDIVKDEPDIYDEQCRGD
ncbi:hypothetical protein FY534_01740 [Alicyclobacillus sp. TC]|uniref:hypothetical protein n=1 Tax=Alicyclobacillus sp. TC TaxID=2606450 RepID=UPI0019323A3A|nr:hypothetical protein [Alicyclobacillus sp. TC]QRF22546.1 hypothetical protein FY534_01740 [Alicyclobacillus sp. TC]